MSQQTPQPEPLVGAPFDPEHDPRGTYAFEPEYAASLTSRILSTTGESVVGHSPGNAQPLASIPQSSDEDVLEAFARARRAQAAWARTSLDHRAEVLSRLHKLVLDRAEEICDVAVWESGKARKDAYLEAYHVALTARYYARTIHRHLDAERRPGVVPLATRIDVNRVPKGSSASSPLGTIRSRWRCATAFRR
nr:aldehyde dehydrogenase family protein [Nocardioides alcanivorans]